MTRLEDQLNQLRLVSAVFFGGGGGGGDGVIQLKSL